MSEWKKMIGYALAIVSLAVVTLTGIAVIGGFKATNLIDNTTATSFQTGLTYFATFVGVLVIAVVGKLVMSLFSKGQGGMD